MKHLKRVLPAILCLSLLLSLCCGFSASASSPEKSASTPAAAEKKEDEKTEPPSPVGEYTLFAVHNEGFTVDAKEMNVESDLTLSEDGTGSMTMVSGTSNETMPLKKWTMSEEGGIELVAEDDSSISCSFRDGLIELLLPGYDGFYLYYAREDADVSGLEVLGVEEFQKLYAEAKAKSASKLYTLWNSLDTKKGVHLNYKVHTDYMDSTRSFDVHGKDGVYYSERTTQVGKVKDTTVNFFQDGKMMLLYPKDKTGKVATETSSALIANNVMLLDELCSAIYGRAQESRFTVETKEIDGKEYEAEVFPASPFRGESVFCYDKDGKLVYYIQQDPEDPVIALGESFYTVYAIDDKVDESLLDIKDYTIK